MGTGVSPERIATGKVVIQLSGPLVPVFPPSTPLRFISVEAIPHIQLCDPVPESEKTPSLPVLHICALAP